MYFAHHEHLYEHLHKHLHEHIYEHLYERLNAAKMKPRPIATTPCRERREIAAEATGGP